MLDSSLAPITVSPSLYQHDFWRWTQAMASALRSNSLDQLDLENLAEEVEGLGRSERSAIESRLTVLLMHLLKWQFQSNLRSGSWEGTLLEQRIRIRRLLKASPSLKSFVVESVSECYEDARAKASIETRLPIDTFPKTCPYPMTDILSMEFLPDASLG